MWPILQFPGDLVTFTVETLNEKLQLLQYDDFMTEVSSAEPISCHFLFWYQGQIQRFWKSGLYVGHQDWPTKKILGFRWSKKTKITLKAISFWRNISISVFKFSPFIFIYNESLPMKYYQFFKTYKPFNKERGKALIQQSTWK